MKTRTQILGAFSLAATAAIVAAHHVPVPLSHVLGADILTQVAFYTDSALFGVPPYVHGVDEVPHHEPIVLAHGDSVQVQHGGLTETVVFESGDFADIARAEIEEVLDVLSRKSTLVEAFDANGFAVVQGTRGGAGESVDLGDVQGSVLSQMHIQPGPVFGSDDLDLTVSTPNPDPTQPHALAGRRYLVLASATDGSFAFRGQTIPIGYDGVLRAVVRPSLQGAMNGFFAQLDAGGDGHALLEGAELAGGLAGAYPDKLYFAYVVFAEDSLQVEFVSNRFTVDFQ